MLLLLKIQQVGCGVKYPSYFLQVIEAFRKLPGVGTRSAERFAFNLLSWSPEQLSELIKAFDDFKNDLKLCDECGCLIDDAGCSFCDNLRRSNETLCITATAKDVFAIETTHEYNGLYHVLGGVLSPLEGYGPEDLSFDKLKERVSRYQVKEIIIALDSTIEGDATALHLRQELDSSGAQISRLAFGLPMGSSFEYVDQGTLAQAIHGRRGF